MPGRPHLHRRAANNERGAVASAAALIGALKMLCFQLTECKQGCVFGNFSVSADQVCCETFLRCFGLVYSVKLRFQVRRIKQ